MGCAAVMSRNPTNENNTVCHSVSEIEGVQKLLLLKHSDPSQPVPARIDAGIVYVLNPLFGQRMAQKEKSPLRLSAAMFRAV